MYEWNGNRYEAFPGGIPGGTATFVCLSSDGRSVAVGLPYDSSSGGSTRVYKNFYHKSECDDADQLLRVSFTTDGNPEELSWELWINSELKLQNSSLLDHNYTTFVEEICVSKKACVEFNVRDSKGNGVSSDCYFKIFVLT